MGTYTKETFRFKKPNRKIKAVYCHCSASDNPSHDNVATIDKWHKKRGWSGVGYHYYVRKDGTIEDGRSLERTPAAQYGYNKGTIAICCGGLSKFTDEQAASLYMICDQINLAYKRRMVYYGHNMVAAKACPVYDWTKWLVLDSKYRMTTSKLTGKLPDPKPPIKNDPDQLESNFPNWDKSPFRMLPNDLPLIKRGSRSTTVATAQMLLSVMDNDKGLGNTDVINGYFGQELENKVKKVQHIYGLTSDGIVGSKTWPAILHHHATMSAMSKK